MFAKNNQISARQSFRLLTYDLLGVGTLLIPTALSGLCGPDGIFAVFFGTVASLLYLKVLRSVFSDMEGGYSEYLTKICGGFFGGILKLCYGIYFLLVSGYVAQLFARLVLTDLLREENFYLILFLLLLLTFYGAAGGIEGRARIYELVFWFLMIPLFLMLIFAAGDADPDYWTPAVTASVFGVAEGSYYVFLCFSIIFLTLFLKEYIPDEKKVYQSGKRAVVFAGAVVAALYLILLGMFGNGALSSMEFPVVTMMSRVQITGGFLKRTDAFMFGIWFFTLYALLNSTVYYGGTVLCGLFGRKKKKESLWVLLFVLCATYLLACVFYYSDAACTIYKHFLWYIGTPFVIVIPVLLVLIRKWTGTNTKSQILRKTSHMAGITAVLLPFLMLSGCKSAEIEDKSFPVLLTVSDTEHFCRDWLNLKQSGNQVADYNHLKIVLIEKEFLEDEALMDELLTVLEGEKDVPQNTYVLGTESVKDIAAVSDNLGEPLGNYLEELLETMPYTKKTAYPTLGMLYQEQKNQMETLFIPCVGLKDEKPAIVGYETWKRGKPAGNTGNDAAMLSFFTANQLKEYTLELAQDYFVRLTNISCKQEFSEEIEASGITKKRVTVLADCEGELLYGKGAISYEEAKPFLEGQMTEYLNRTAAEALSGGIDVANSMKKLGGSKREWYFYYRDVPYEYEEDISIEYKVRIKWID